MAARKKISDELAAAIVDMYLQCRSPVKIISRFGIGSSTLNRLLKRRGIDRTVKPWPEWRCAAKRRLTADQERELARAYADGTPGSVLARQFSCSAWAIREAVRRQGIAMRPAGGGGQKRTFSAIELQDMANLWLAGESQHAIANQLGLTQSVVSRILREAGFQKETRVKRGSRHGQWRGGRTMTREGYWMVVVEDADPMASMRNRMGYVLEHRLVMARHMGRPLSPSETVHHINGNRDDNRAENLQLRHGRHGNGVVLVCNSCGSCDISQRPIADPPSVPIPAKEIGAPN